MFSLEKFTTVFFKKNTHVSIKDAEDVLRMFYLYIENAEKQMFESSQGENQEFLPVASP